MLPALKKLHALWPHREAIFKTHPAAVARVNQVFEIASRWDGRVSESFDLPTPEEEGIPVDNWASVKKSIRDIYEAHQVPNPDDIDDVDSLFCVNRPIANDRFRLSSNAASKSDYETGNFHVGRTNTESYVGSYNYPFQIIRRYHDSLESLEHLPDAKFIAKFLWLLRQRVENLPILSFASYLKLAADLKSGFPWIDRSVPIGEFRDKWPAASSHIALAITGKEYSQLDVKERLDLTKFVFVTTINFTSVRNALNMLDTGNRAMIFHGPPGTGKTWHARKITAEKLGLEGKSFDEARFSYSQGSNPAGSWEVVQFHPNYTYHDFIGGIAPSLKDDETLGYTFRKGLFLRFCEAAKAAGKDQPFILIIDEINRADLSAVFGELMYAIEYRGHSVAVPHIPAFEIPENVRIIGTMNSNDRSLANFDLALRRRFLFYKLMPDLSSLHAWNSTPGEVAFEDEQIEELIRRAEALNKAIVDPRSGLGLSVDYGIGQAYFMKIRGFARMGIPEGDQTAIDDFHYEQLWDYHLEPLIEEYLGTEAEDPTYRAKLKEIRRQFTSGT
jgi:MoxR-like ATPase